MLVWYNLYIIIISWNVTCCPHDIIGPFCLILRKTTIPHSYVINIKWKITNTTLSAQYQNIRIFFQWMVYMFKMRSSMMPIIYVCSTMSVSERGKLYHTCNMFMFWSLCSRKREAVSYIQHVYDLDFMNRKGWNCIIPTICFCSGVCVSEGENCVIPTICLCSRYCVSERGKLYHTYNMFMLYILCIRKRETISHPQYVYVLDFVYQKERNYFISNVCVWSRLCI
jgi:hypothetical protein